MASLGRGGETAGASRRDCYCRARRLRRLRVKVGAPRQTVYRWLEVLNASGIDALREMSKGGRPAQLDSAQHEQLREILLAGPPGSPGLARICGRSSGCAR